MKNRWTHSFCDECFIKVEGERVAVRLDEDIRTTELCCACGQEHRSGIYKRANPSNMPCEGKYMMHLPEETE